MVYKVPLSPCCTKFLIDIGTPYDHVRSLIGVTKKVDIKGTLMMDDFFILHAIWHVSKSLMKSQGLFEGINKFWYLKSWRLPQRNPTYPTTLTNECHQKEEKTCT